MYMSHVHVHVHVHVLGLVRATSCVAISCTCVFHLTLSPSLRGRARRVRELHRAWPPAASGHVSGHGHGHGREKRVPRFACFWVSNTSLCTRLGGVGQKHVDDTAPRRLVFAGRLVRAPLRDASTSVSGGYHGYRGFVTKDGVRRET